MGFSFNFFGEQEHRVFNYRPRYYDPQEEERRRMFGAVDGSQDSDSREPGTREPGSYIRGSLRDGNYQRTRSDRTSMAQRLIGIVGLLLFFTILYFVIRFYGLIL